MSELRNKPLGKRKEILRILREHKLSLSSAIAVQVLISFKQRREETRRVAKILTNVDRAVRSTLNPIRKLLNMAGEEQVPWILDWRLRGIDDPVALARGLEILASRRPSEVRKRGRPTDLEVWSFLSSAANIYEKGTRKPASAARYDFTGGGRTWGPFIRFAVSCAQLAGLDGLTESRLGTTWIRLQKKKRSR